MTISSTVTKVTASGNGSTTAFSFNFLIPAAGDEQITITDSAGDQTVLNPTQYLVMGFNNPAGGTVTFPLSGSPLPAGSSITIARILPLTQEISIGNQSPFAPQAVETGLDNTVMQIQQIAEAQGRVLSAPIVDPATIDLTLPAAAQRAGQLVGFDASGNVIAAQPSSALVSSPMQPVVNASSLANARTQLGLGAAALEGVGAGLQDDGAGNIRVDFQTNPIANNTNVTAASHMTQYIIKLACNLTLPKASTLWNGFGFFVFGAGGAGTLTPVATDVIQNGSSGASFVIANGGQAWVTTDGISGWQVLYVAPAAPAPTTTPVLASAAGLVVQNNATTPNTQIDITRSQAVLTTATGLGFFVGAGTITINLLANGINGLDSGARAAGTFYYLFLISNGSTVASIASLSPTAPTLPTGFIYTMRVGAMQTDASSNLRTTVQIGRRVQFTGTLQVFFGTITYASFFPPVSESAIILALSTATNSVAVIDMAGVNIAAFSGSQRSLVELQNIGLSTFSAPAGTPSPYGWIDRINAT